MKARYPDKQFTPCPEGMHQAVCVDVVDLGEVDTMHGRKFRVRLAWQIADLDKATGRRHSVVKTYNNSMFKTATLRADIDRWRGKKLTEAEAKDFELDVLIGANCLISVVHNVSLTRGETFANVDAILPLPKGYAKLTPLDYIRRQDRTTTAAAPPSSREPVEEDDDISFSMQELDPGEVR
jgi:hypothetical protein